MSTSPTPHWIDPMPRDERKTYICIAIIYAPPLLFILGALIYKVLA